MHILTNRHTLRQALVIVASVVGGVLLAPYTVAVATQGDIGAPFEAGTSWYVCQGYNGPYTHQGTYALDITSSQSCDTTAQSGQNVLAPLAGTVAWYGATYGSMCLNTLDGRSIALYHIVSSLKYADPVARGQIVGTIGAGGTVGNNGIPHLHIEMWTTPGCTGAAMIPFDAAHNAQMCGMADLTPDGPNYYNNGAWSGALLMPQACDGSASIVYRLYSPVTKHHLFTSDTNEALTLRQNTSVWNYEGPAFQVKALSNCAATESVYRFYSETLRTHLYTLDQNEKEHIINNFPEDIWRYEGVAYCADTTQSEATKPVYRFYSELLKSHLYTIDENEKNTIIQTYSVDIWRYEGISYYAVP